jgi:gamma-glutamylcyclotransferase (GGCT)/AIG2-like uncharacterized protein YtfP
MRLCFYGSLKRGGKLNGILLDGKATFLGESTFEGDLFHLGSYPAAVKGSGVVHCEVWECSDALVKRLDGVEGHPWMYLRSKVWTPEFGEVQTYVYQRHLRGAKLIASGNYNVADWK